MQGEVSRCKQCETDQTQWKEIPIDGQARHSIHHGIHWTYRTMWTPPMTRLTRGTDEATSIAGVETKTWFQGGGAVRADEALPTLETHQQSLRIENRVYWCPKPASESPAPATLPSGSATHRNSLCHCTVVDPRPRCSLRVPRDSRLELLPKPTSGDTPLYHFLRFMFFSEFLQVFTKYKIVKLCANWYVGVSVDNTAFS